MSYRADTDKNGILLADERRYMRGKNQEGGFRCGWPTRPCGPRRSCCKQCRQVGKAKQQASYVSLTTKAAPCLSINHEEQRHGAYGKDAAIISWNKCELATHLRSKASATLAKAQCAESAEQVKNLKNSIEEAVAKAASSHEFLNAAHGTAWGQ